MREKAEKTEKATPRRREEARKRGYVARSAEVNSALILLIGACLIRFMIPWAISLLRGTMIEFLHFSPYQITLDNVTPLLFKLLMVLLLMVLPLAVLLMFIGLISNYVQTGFVFNMEGLALSWERINPIAGLSNLISLRSCAEFAKSFIKLFIIGYMVYHVLSSEFFDFQSLPFIGIRGMAAHAGRNMFKLSAYISLSLLLLALLDYSYQRWEHEKKLRMTREELKEEIKQTEGDPLVRARMRNRQREYSLRLRITQETKKADVVITNPEEIAVALAYDPMEMRAPKLVAKGMNLLARRIKEVARRNNIPIVENRYLARILYKSVNVGQEIPVMLYKAVAEILAYVYASKERG